LQVKGNDGNDTFRLDNGAGPALLTTLDGGDGNNTFNLISGAANPPLDNPRLVVAAVGGRGNDVYNLHADSGIIGKLNEGISLPPDADTLNIIGSEGADAISIGNSAVASRSVNGGGAIVNTSVVYG